MRLKLFHSHRHAEAASYFAQEAREIERRYCEGEEDRKIHGFSNGNRHRSLVVNSITSSMSLVEAAVNEVYDSIQDDIKRLQREEWKVNEPADLRAYRLISRLDDFTRHDFPRKSTLEKYQLLLAYMDQEPFDPGQAPYQEVDSVRVLRNYFVHYEPRWTEPESGIDLKGQEKRLRELEGKFEPNPLAGEHNAFFPDKCLGYGCAKWAFEASSTFVNSFFKRTDATSPIEHIPDHVQLSDQ